jgi:cytochrome P450
VSRSRAIPPEFLPPIPEPFRPFFEQTGDWFIFRDPPDHTRLRKLVSGALTRKQVEQLEPRIRQVATDLLDCAGDAQQIDVIRDYAATLPVIIIADLLGMPLDNRQQLHHWSKRFLRAETAPVGRSAAFADGGDHCRAGVFRTHSRRDRGEATPS